jgi:hypothetical protein
VTAGTLVLAVICGGLFTICGLIVAVTVRHAFFRAWAGSEAVVVVVLVAICWALGLGQLLGAVGLLRRGALLVGALVTAGVAVAAAHRWPPHDGPRLADAAKATDTSEPVTPGWSQHLMVATTALLVLAVAALWVARTVIAVHRGINDPDSLGYHLAFATTFAQTGYADQHRYVLPFLPVHFYPANDELLQAMALAVTHSVAFSAVKNLLFGGFILVAAHAIGKQYRAGAAAVAAAAIVLGLPVITFSQPGEAVNDALLLLVLLGGLAVLAHARDRPAPYLLAMASAGVAVGIKFSAVYPAVALAVFALVLLCARVPGHRLRWAVSGALSAVALGGSWYLRNAITFHNPVPPAAIGLGPLHLPQIATVAGPRSKSVLGYVEHGRFLSVFRHGLALGLGPLVALVLGAWIVGAIANLLRPDGFRRGVGLYALVAGLGYMATPASAYGLDGPLHTPVGFVLNLHYAAAALLVGLIAFALVVGRWRLAFLFPAFGLVVVATGVRPGQRIAFWSPEIGGASFGWLLGAAGVAGAAVVLARWPGARRGAAVAGAGAAVMAVVGVALVAHRYPSGPATDPVQKWAAHVGGTRVAAYVPDIALLYGPGSPNRVVTLTRLAAHAPVPLDSCPAWMAAIIAGHYPYSAVIPLTPWHLWLASDPAFKVVAHDQLAAVFQVVGVPDVNCPAAAKG